MLFLVGFRQNGDIERFKVMISYVEWGSIDVCSRRGTDEELVQGISFPPLCVVEQLLNVEEKEFRIDRRPDGW